MILVTGGTGLVGSHLLYELVKNDVPVRAIYRRQHKLESVKKVFGYYTNDVDFLYNQIEWIEADLNDVPSLSEAFRDISRVYHCAAFISFEPDKYRLLRKINIEGTANIVNLCVANQIEKLCYVSSVAAIGNELDPHKHITEQTVWNPEDDHSVYSITKYGAQMEVWRGTQEGVDAVIVNPGIIIGPGLWRGGGSGSLIHQIYKGFPYYTDGTTGYVDVHDVVQIMMQLMNSDIKNESFILVAENLSFKDFQEKVAKALGVKPAKKEATKFLLQLGWRLDWLRHKILGKRRRFSKQMARTARSKTFYDNEKIRKTLNLEFIPMDVSIKETCDYYKNDLNVD